MTSSINNENLNNSKLYGFLGTSFFCILLFLFMWYYIIPFTTLTESTQEEGIMVSFGDNENAGGMGSSSEPLAAPEAEILAPTKQQKATSRPASKEQLVTTNDNANAISIAEQKQKQKEIDRKQKQIIEQQQIDAENRIAQQKRKEQEAINKAGATVNGLFTNGSTKSGIGNGKGSGNGTGNGSGNGSESGLQGNPAGHGNLGGNSWSLNGRNLMGTLISPSYKRDVEGKVTVNIRVDQNGNVTSTSIGSPTTISDGQTINAAFDAAKRTHFTNSNDISSGSITYNFKLN